MDTNSLRVKHHTMPPEICVEALESQYLPDNLVVFIDIIEEQLYKLMRSYLDLKLTNDSVSI